MQLYLTSSAQTGLKGSCSVVQRTLIRKNNYTILYLVLCGYICIYTLVIFAYSFIYSHVYIKTLYCEDLCPLPGKLVFIRSYMTAEPFV
jgi:hypothetical protein